MKREIKKALSLFLWGLYGVVVLSFIMMGTSCGGGSGGRHGGGLFGADDGYRSYDSGRDDRNQWRQDHPNTPNTPPPFAVPDNINRRIPR